MRKSIAVAALAAAALLPSSSSRAGEETGPDKLLARIPRARVSLADGLRWTTAKGETPLSAKYEFDREGNLALSVYTAEKGFDAGAEHAVLKEWIGPPSGETWTPTAEVFADAPHVARSAEQFALLAVAPVTLVSLVERMEQAAGGPVVSVTPVLRGRRALVLGRTLKDGNVREWTADLATGTFLPPAPGAATVRIPVKRHESVRVGEWVVEYGCAGVGDGNGFVYFKVTESARAVERILIVNGKGETLLAPAPKAERGSFCEANVGKEFGEPTELWIFTKDR